MTDHYQLLQVRRDASPEVISAAYRRLMKDAHPDRGGDAERAKRLNAAYETLSDPAARRSYDASLPTEAQPPRAFGPEIAFRVGRGLGRQLGRLRREMQ
ncbi:MAG: J domain-containing protein [Coriobacteriia bacterium]|nr:J domain-containing protein [Coriobacteriia bacterium]